MFKNWSDGLNLGRFSSVIPVKGARRSVICDLQRRNYYIVPNALYNLLKSCSGKSKEEIQEFFLIESEKDLEEYFDFLEKNELVFWASTEDINLFPEMSMKWEWPSEITNAIIDIVSLEKLDYQKILSDLDLLRCKHIQLRIYKDIDASTLFDLIYTFNTSTFKTIQVLINFSSHREIMKQLTNLTTRVKLSRIETIIFYCAPYNKVEIDSGTNIQLGFLTEHISSSLSCGQIHHNYFNSNINLFTEAQQHNTCLNRKISIDVNGEIKNCPSLAKSYGNIKDTTLAEAIEKPGFKDLWFINKDKIHVCKDCEFRYICTDCRAYIENPEDIYSKPLKCGYNPYTAEWEEWSTNPLKQKAIEYYGMQDLVKKTTSA